VIPAILSLVGYLCFWFPGVLLNWYFLGEARKLRRQTGRAPRGMLFLQILMWVFVFFPLLWLTAVLGMAVSAAFLARAFV
jgi:hypothetical protein